MRYLPKVNPEVGYSISRSFKDDADYYNRMMKLIKKENPAVAEFIEKWSERAEEGEPDCPLHAAFCGIFVYALLRGQAEANYMYETIKL